MVETPVLPELPHWAGAVVTPRARPAAPAHYRPPAACLASDGLAERSDLAVLSIGASRRRLDYLLTRVLGHAGRTPGILGIGLDSIQRCLSREHTARRIISPQ